MAFDLQQWKDAIRQRIHEFAQNPQGAAAGSLFGFLSGMTLFPLAKAIGQGDVAGAFMALGGIAASVGSNLVAEQVQHWVDRTEAEAAAELDQAINESAELRQALDTILGELEVLRQTYQALSEDDRHWLTVTLNKELARFGAELQQTRTVVGDWVKGDKFAGDKVMGDKITIINQYLSAPGEPEFDAEMYRQALDRYLEWVCQTYGQLSLRGIERRQEWVLTLGLDDVYVPLDAEVTAERAERRHLKEEGLAGERPEGALVAERHAERINMRDLLGLGTRQVVIGGPGCGKTTVLRYIAYMLARAILDDNAALAEDKLGLSSPLPLPVFIPLSEYNQHRQRMAADRDPRAATLTTFISHHLISREAVRGLPADFFERLLVSGKACVILMDGLDEVADERERALVRQAVQNLANASPQARCVVTSRTRAYGGGAVLPEDFRVCSVQPMDEEHVETLVGYWCRAVYRDRAECARESDDLLRAIRELEALRPLVDTPLLVTIVAIVHYNRRRLPDQRVELYDECVQVLLAERHHPVSETQFALADWGGTMAEKRNLLSYLAFEMHQGGEERGRIIAEGRLRAVLAPRFERKHGDKAEGRLREFIRAVRERGSLLDERGGQYQFTHLSFQEFLAARHLAESVREVDKIAAFLEEEKRATDSWWREPILLLAGYLAINSDEQAIALLRRLNALAGTPSVRLAGAELAATALVEMIAPDSEVQDEVSQHLVTLLTDGDFIGVTRGERARAGRALGLLGDPRDLEELVTVPASEFWMGSETEAAWSDEKLAHKVHLVEFRIGKCPVTNAQFKRFGDADGYNQEKYWTKAGWAWRQGDFGEKPEGYSDEGWEKSVTGRQHFDRPEFSDDPQRNVPNHPVVGVTWHEAIAYTRWLTEVWRSEGRIEQGQVVRLPTEAEWEKAARGDRDRREYPWGDKFDPDRLNLDVGDEPVGGTSAVGIFPLGSSPYGCLDLSGNVWEWCSSLYQDYPYYPDDGREDLEAEGRRLLRGGSWFSFSEGFARCSFRDGALPSYFAGNYGFRILVSARSLPVL